MSVHGLGTSGLPVPTARMFEAVAQLTSRGLASLPAGAAPALGVAFAGGLLLAGAETRERWARVLPSPAAMGIGFFIPAYYSVTICLGALLALAVGRARPTALETLRAVGTGTILGETLPSVLISLGIAAGWMAPPA